MPLGENTLQPVLMRSQPLFFIYFVKPRLQRSYVKIINYKKSLHKSNAMVVVPGSAIADLQYQLKSGEVL